MQEHIFQLIASVVCIILLPVFKYLSRNIIRKYATLSRKLESRTNHVIRIISILINLSLIISLIIIWGVDPHNLLVALSSIFAVIGVAMFAQWSLLSNVTAGILIFFSSPFRVGDHIRVLDKDMGFEAKVDDILTFHTHLITKSGERISYPNSLFFQKGVSIIKIQDWTSIDSE